MENSQRDDHSQLYKIVSALECEAAEIRIEINTSDLFERAVTEFDFYANEQLSAVECEFSLRRYENQLLRKALTISGVALPVRNAIRKAACEFLAKLLSVKA